MSVPERLSAALADRYTIERELGYGGMATVYLAQDLKHDRKVAVKVLKPELAAVVGGERFISEIRTTANLQHPHILPLFDSGEADSFLFYVMPYVEGETLREKLDREKQLSVPEAIAITVKIAGALQSAHDQGIIHRDIKPGNILLQNGEPVVADFGIALAVRQAGEGRITETGLSLGTPYYMAPEQATGDRDPDQRSDLYSLACMLYEMLTGEPPFQGTTAQAVLGRILTEPPPDVTRARPSVPPHIGAILTKALQKLPADRFESVAEFSRALQTESYVDPTARASGAWAAAQGKGPAWKRVLPWGVAAAAVVVAAIAVIAGVGAPSTPPQPSFRTSLDVSDLPELAAFITQVQISDDGTRMLFFGGSGEGDAIHVRGPEDERFRVLPGTEDTFWAEFSPDGESIVFTTGADDGLWKVTFEGSQPRRFAEVGSGAGVDYYFVDWADDGTIVFLGDEGEGDMLYRVPESGGTPEPLHGGTGERDAFVPPRVLPGGVGIVGAQANDDGLTDVVVFVPGEDSVRLLVPDAQMPMYVAPGYLTFVTSGGDLLARPFDLRTLEFTGDAKVVQGGVQVSGSYYARYDVSRNGTLVFGSGPSVGGAGLSRQYQLALVGLDGARTDLALPPRDIRAPRWSPTDARIAFVGVAPSITSGEAEQQIWTFDTEVQNDPRQLTELGGTQPVWSPDGRQIAFSSSREGADGVDIFLKDVDSDAPPTLLWSAPGAQFVTDWPADTLLVLEDGSPSQLTRLRLSGDTTTYISPAADVDEGVVSPDGRWMAYASDEAGFDNVYVRAYPDPRIQIPISQADTRREDPRWSPDGRTLYYLGPDSVYAAALELDPTLRPLQRRGLFSRSDGQRALTSYDLAPDGDRFIASYLVLSDADADADAESGDLAPFRYHVIHNWFTDLEQLFEDERR